MKVTKSDYDCFFSNDVYLIGTNEMWIENDRNKSDYVLLINPFCQGILVGIFGYYFIYFTFIILLTDEYPAKSNGDYYYIGGGKD